MTKAPAAWKKQQLEAGELEQNVEPKAETQVNKRQLRERASTSMDCITPRATPGKKPKRTACERACQPQRTASKGPKGYQPRYAAAVKAAKEE